MIRALKTRAEMQALWAAYLQAQGSYREEHPSSIKPFERARRAIVAAGTVDLEGIAIKLKVADESCSFDAVRNVVRDIEASLRDAKGGEA